MFVCLLSYCSHSKRERERERERVCYIFWNVGVLHNLRGTYATSIYQLSSVKAYLEIYIYSVASVSGVSKSQTHGCLVVFSRECLVQILRYSFSI